MHFGLECKVPDADKVTEYPMAKPSMERSLTSKRRLARRSGHVKPNIMVSKMMCGVRLITCDERNGEWRREKLKM